MGIKNRIIRKAKKTRNNILLKNKDITIISQNCVGGGVLYSDFGLSFQSPTINMFIEDENFVKLVENFEYYMRLPAEPLTDCYVDPINPDIRYPKIAVGDIELCCLHYHNCREAIDAWERRKKRVNLKKIFVIANSWNMHENEELVKRVCSSKYKTICITFNEYDIDGCIAVKGDFWKLDERSIIRPNITDWIPGKNRRYYEDMFDFLAWFNSVKS